MFKDTPEGQTHFNGDGCPEHTDPVCLTIKKLEEEFDEIYSQCEDGPDKLLCTHESHKEMLKHFIFHTYTKELLEAVKDKVNEITRTEPCDEYTDQEKFGFEACRDNLQSFLDSTLSSLQARETKE